MRKFSGLSLLIAVVLTTGLVNAPAFAKDGDSEGGGSDDGGSENSGSGSNNSGSNDDDNEEDDDDDDNSDSKHKDQNRALKAVKQGKAVSLSKLKSFLSQNYPGKLLKVSLEKKSGKFFYRVWILSEGNHIKTLSLNALTLKPGAT